MLKIQNRHVLWDTHQISIPAAHAKDAESRRISFEPNLHLAQILKRRRFLCAPMCRRKSRTILVTVVTWAEPAAELSVRTKGRRSAH
jgi:hypothetical protein